MPVYRDDRIFLQQLLVLMVRTGNLLRGSSVSVCTMDLKQGSATRTAGMRKVMLRIRWDIAVGTFLYPNRSLMT